MLATRGHLFVGKNRRSTWFTERAMEVAGTEEEEMEFYRRTGGAKSLTIYRSQRPASADKPHPKEEKAGG